MPHAALRRLRWFLATALVAAIVGALAPAAQPAPAAFSCAPYSVSGTPGNCTGEGCDRGKLTVSPAVVRGEPITISGTGFPALTNLSALTVGGVNALQAPAPATDASGQFKVTVVPSGMRWACVFPGLWWINAKVGDVLGVTSVVALGPHIILSLNSALPGQWTTIVGSGFSAYSIAEVMIGGANVTPMPPPRTDGVGSFAARVTVPDLDPGFYRVKVGTYGIHTATAWLRVVDGSSPPAEVLQPLTKRDLLALAAAVGPGETTYRAYVPGLPGDSLSSIKPFGTLVLTLTEDTMISVSGRPAVLVAADTPTIFTIGRAVSVEVVE